MLSGEVVGRGPDNEPLVGSFEPLAYLHNSLVVEAGVLYESAFAVSRGSANHPEC